MSVFWWIWLGLLHGASADHAVALAVLSQTTGASPLRVALEWTASHVVVLMAALVVLRQCPLPVWNALSVWGPRAGGFGLIIVGIVVLVDAVWPRGRLHAHMHTHHRHTSGTHWHWHWHWHTWRAIHRTWSGGSTSDLHDHGHGAGWVRVLALPLALGTLRMVALAASIRTAESVTSTVFLLLSHGLGIGLGTLVLAVPLSMGLHRVPPRAGRILAGGIGLSAVASGVSLAWG